MKGIIVYNVNKKEAFDVANDVKKFFINKNIEIIDEKFISDANFAVVIGGDGTLLRAAKTLINNNNIDIFAINVGTLGFLTEIKFAEFYTTFENYLNGNINRESRYLLEVTLGNKKIDVLNEVLISKIDFSSKLISINVETKKTKICNYKADGLIVATTTGSTAYSLSAGGPIVMPQINAMVLTPLSPHNLATRPILISGDEELTLNSKDCAIVNVDSEMNYKLKANEKLQIKYSGKKINLILPENRDYYEVLRSKLKWGENLC